MELSAKERAILVQAMRDTARENLTELVEDWNPERANFVIAQALSLLQRAEKIERGK